MLCILIYGDDCIIAGWAAPIVWAAAVFVINGNASVSDVISFEELNVAVDLHTIFVFSDRFVLEACRANAFVTFKVL